MILRLFLTDSVAWWGLALYAEVYDIHSEPNETREAVCITRRSHHFGPGKSNIYSEISFNETASVPFFVIIFFIFMFSLYLGQADWSCYKRKVDFWTFPYLLPQLDCCTKPTSAILLAAQEDETCFSISGIISRHTTSHELQFSRVINFSFLVIEGS